MRTRSPPVGLAAVVGGRGGVVLALRCGVAAGATWPTVISGDGAALAAGSTRPGDGRRTTVWPDRSLAPTMTPTASGRHVRMTGRARLGRAGRDARLGATRAGAKVGAGGGSSSHSKTANGTPLVAPPSSR